MSQYPVGIPGKPWNEEHKAQWLANQKIQRSYQQEVIDKLEPLQVDFDVHTYGTLEYSHGSYPLMAVRSHNWAEHKPIALVTGGVHGYETSGVQGAIRFLQEAARKYAQHLNLVVLPCISPWGYETINRWNPMAVDPNRSFKPNSPSSEAAQAMAYVSALGKAPLVHIDLHETTDTDNSEFRPALAARDGTSHDNWNIPDGFYLVGDTSDPQPAFQKAMIEAVEKVTHIAPADEQGKIIGADLQQPGVINYDKKGLFLCAGMTDANYVSTTEVYPDSPATTPENCIQAQVAAVVGGLDYVIKAHGQDA